MSLVAGDESISPSELKAIAQERTGGGALLLADTRTFLGFNSNAQT